MSIVDELKQIITTWGGNTDGIHTIPEAVQALKSIKPQKQTGRKKPIEPVEE